MFNHLSGLVRSRTGVFKQSPSAAKSQKRMTKVIEIFEKQINPDHNSDDDIDENFDD